MHARLAIAVSLILVVPEVANAGGYYVPEVGPRAASMGGALAAQDADASAIFHNPAGIVGQPGSQVQVVGTLFFPNVEFFRRPIPDPNSPDNNVISFGASSNTNTVGLAPYLGATSDLGNRKLAIGLALSVPFGAAIDYADDSSQRHVVTHVSLAAIHLSPAIAYQVSDRFRVGASVNLIHTTLRLEQRNAIPYLTGDPEVFPDPDPALEGDTVLDGSDPFSLSATIGALYTSPSRRVQIGVSVLTPVTLKLRGDASVSNSAITPLIDANGNELQPAGQRTDAFTSEIPLPMIARVGIAARPTSQLTIVADVNWQRWSAFDELVIDFENEHELLPTPGAFLYDVAVENSWSDTFSVRLGAEVTPLATRPLQVRGGLLYDQSPVDDGHYDLITPDSDKFGVGLGAGYRFIVGSGVAVDIDIAYQHLFVAERDIGQSEKTILNKPASSFYSGVARARFDILQLGANVRF